MHVDIAALRNQSNGNRSYILDLKYHFDKATEPNLYILALGHHFDTETTNRSYIFDLGGTISRPKQWQHVVHLRFAAPLRDQSNGNKSYILDLGHHFETKAMAKIILRTQTRHSIPKVYTANSSPNSRFFLPVSKQKAFKRLIILRTQTRHSIPKVYTANSSPNSRFFLPVCQTKAFKRLIQRIQRRRTGGITTQTAGGLNGRMEDRIKQRFRKRGAPALSSKTLMRSLANPAGFRSEERTDEY